MVVSENYTPDVAERATGIFVRSIRSSVVVERLVGSHQVYAIRWLALGGCTAIGANFEEAQCWRSSSRTEVSYEESVMFLFDFLVVFFHWLGRACPSRVTCS